MPASAEFIALCQSQVMLLTQSLGASLTVVYLTEELTEEADAKLVPIVAYPEAASTWQADQVLSLFSRRQQSMGGQRLLPSGASTRSISTSWLALPDAQQIREEETGQPSMNEAGSTTTSASFKSEDLLLEEQIVLPLIYEGVVMGLLVTVRSDCPWREPEHTQIERIARTLAIACVLDQRGQWLENDLQQQRLLQAQQHDVFDTLLHQFRNPLTALRTFGKLLAKRFLPSDRNRELADGIVRESDRLQELLQQFDAAIDLGEANLLPSAEALNPSTIWDAQITSDQPTKTDAHASALSSTKPMLPGGVAYLTGAALQLETHCLTEVLEPLLISAGAIAQDRQLHLRVNLPAHLPPVQMDVKALREVLSNLIDNALKYTPVDGKVYVRVTRLSRQRQQAIVIADTGPGIPPQDLEHLFEPHYRGVQAQTDIPGTGLGLAIARNLILQMQGEIQVFSPAQASHLLGKFRQDLIADGNPGTAVVVWLPETPIEL